MNVLELFAGSRSFAKVASVKGHQVFTSDNVQYGEIDYIVDVMLLDAIGTDTTRQRLIRPG